MNIEDELPMANHPAMESKRAATDSDSDVQCLRPEMNSVKSIVPNISLERFFCLQ